nr:hypothetical protein [uncultured Albidiferax sp.]
MTETLPESSAPAMSSSPRFNRARRVAAYLLSTKVLVGGILAFVGTQTVEAYKIYRTESRDDIKSVTDKVSDLVKELPTDSGGVSKVIQKVENLYIIFRSVPAREYISGVVGQLSDRKARYSEQESSERKAADAARLAEEAKAKSAAAAQAAEEAQAAKAAETARLQADAKAQAAAAAVAALVAQRQAADAEEAKRQAEREAKAYFDQRRWDRMPK